MENVEFTSKQEPGTGPIEEARAAASERQAGPARERLQLEVRARRWWAAYGGSAVSSR